MATAFIWGASGGIGSALVKAAKREGMTVYGAARNIDAIPVEADETFSFDASDPNSYRDIALLLADEATEPDLVIYAAGTMHTSTLEGLSTEEWQSVLDANLHGAYLGVQSLLHLVPKGGHVMVIGAYVEKITLPRFGAYTTAKAALSPMMTIFAKENRKKHFTLVRPPAVATPFWDNVPVSLPDNALQPGEVAERIISHYQSGEDGVLDL